MNSLTAKPRSINRAPSPGAFEAPPNVSPQSTGEAAPKEEAPAEETDYTFYYSGAGVLMLCMCAMYFTRLGEKRTEVMDISEMEEAKPEAKPPKKCKSDKYEASDPQNAPREGEPS